MRTVRVYQVLESELNLLSEMCHGWSFALWFGASALMFAAFSVWWLADLDPHARIGVAGAAFAVNELVVVLAGASLARTVKRTVRRVFKESELADPPPQE